jgi:hypothetical protein
MSGEAQEIERRMKNLPLKDMLALHVRLVETIHAKEESESLDPAYVAELQKRVEEIESDTARPLDAFEELRKI